MRICECIITEDRGLDARTAGLIAQACTDLRGSVVVEANGRRADGNNVLQLLDLEAGEGDLLRFTIDGPEEEKIHRAIHDILDEIGTEARSQHAPLRIAFFGAKKYDRMFFSELAEEDDSYNVEIKYFKTRLTPETAHLAEGCEAVCIFVNDDASAGSLKILYETGVRLILLRCAGFNNVDIDCAKELGLTVLRVPAYSPYAVAEHAMAIIQAANRRIHKGYSRVRDNNFALNGLMGLDLHNKVAGIIGVGKIGECMARICKGYGMQVLAWDAYPNSSFEEEGLLTYVSKEELFTKADLISLHTPLIMGPGGTYHIIDAEAISKMKKTAMLVNTSRGPLIDTEALIDALKNGKFHAVALDVYEGEDSNVYTDFSDEPIRNDITARLLTFPNLVLSSHQAFFTREAMQAIAVVTLENARSFHEGPDYHPTEKGVSVDRSV